LLYKDRILEKVLIQAGWLLRVISVITKIVDELGNTDPHGILNFYNCATFTPGYLLLVG
jgi:hypothetical protein